METKIATSINQSNQLIELGIDINTADMYYYKENTFKNALATFNGKLLVKGNSKPRVEDTIPAWSEEDENLLSRCICDFDYLIKNENRGFEERYKEQIDWLKSLKPQPHWKPTEEQIHCFKCVIDFYKTKVNDTTVQNLLNSLYDNLKKL